MTGRPPAPPPSYRPLVERWLEDSENVGVSETEPLGPEDEAWQPDLPEPARELAAAVAALERAVR